MRVSSLSPVNLSGVYLSYPPWAAASSYDGVNASIPEASV